MAADPELAAVRAAHPQPERVAARIVLAYFLLQTTSKRVEFEPELLFEPERSLGWDLVVAQAARNGVPVGAGAGRRRDARRGRHGPGLPLRRRPVGALPPPSAQRRRRPRPGAARPLPLALRPLVGGRGALAAGRGDRPGGPRRRRPRPRAGGGVMRTLLVDNHDSYTYNVFHLLAAASGEEPVVVNNDAVSWRVLSRSKFDAFVLSPGPGRPERWHDFGVCRDILRYSEVPVLGICLGHQGIGNLLEGGVTSAPQPMHGRLSHVRHRGTGIFAGVPQDFSVVRYHSLAITGPVGPEGHVVAWADDGVVMGVEHDSRPIWGVQFHPESIATEFGDRIARNFFELAERARRAPPTSSNSPGPLPRAFPRAPIADGTKTGPCVRFPAHRPGWCAEVCLGSGRCCRGRWRGRRRPSTSTNGSSATPRSPSGSTRPTRRPGSPSAPIWGRARGRESGTSPTTSTPPRRRSARRAVRRSATDRSSSCSSRRCGRSRPRRRSASTAG